MGTLKQGKHNSCLANDCKLRLQAGIRLLKVFTLLLILLYDTDATAQTKTRVIGAANWNTASTWIQLRTGTAAFTNASVAVTGTGTLFLTELQAGDVLMMNTTPGTVRGTVASIQSNTSLTLLAAATASIGTATYGRQTIPGSADNVEIGNTTVAGVVNVTLDTVTTTVSSLTFIAHNYSHSLTHAGSNNLSVTGFVTLNQPTGNNFMIAWNINAGSTTVSGLVSFLGANNFNRIIALVLTSGILNAFGGITFSAIGTVANKVIDISGGAGILNLKGGLTTCSNATLTAGTSGSIFNYADNVSAQTINFFAAGAYYNLNLNNTNSGGAILSAAITTTNVIGNIRVLSGTMYNGGFAIALNNSKVFEIANSATCKLTGTSGMVTGTSITKTFGATSTVDYNGAAQTVSAETYGHLTLSNSGVKTMPASAIILAGNFTMSGTASSTALNSMTIGGDAILNAGSTFNEGALNHGVAGNWTNNGGLFTPGAGTVTFNGTTAQSITGATTFNNFTLNNTQPGNALTLNNPITVNGILTLTDGHLITTSTNVLTLGVGANITLNGSPQDSSFVKGPMIQTVDVTASTAKTFPVGKNNQMHRADLTVTQSSSTPTQYTGEFFNSSARALGYTLPATLDTVSAISYWIISKGAGSSITSASVKLYYFSSDNVTDAPNLRIAKDNGAGAWTDIGGTGTAIPGGTITSSNNFTSFSKFSLANNTGGSNPLPVGLLNFTAKLNGNLVDISWSTASEINNDYFTAERSADATHFEEVIKVKGAGNSNVILNYNTTDMHPLKGNSYYRLKQTDFNGMFKYSNISEVNFKDDFNCNVFPNPASKEITYVSFSGTINETVNIDLFDAVGNAMFSKSALLEETGVNNIAIDPAQQLSKGVYIIIVTTAQNIYKHKLVIN